MTPCWKPSSPRNIEEDGFNSSKNGDGKGRVNGLLWYKDYGKHVNGEFSMAVVQANKLLEDQSQIESGSLSLSLGDGEFNGPVGTFVGIYDGHAGTEAARFVSNQLFKNIKSKL